MSRKIFLLMGFALLTVLAPTLNSPSLSAADEPETLEEARQRQADVDRERLETLAEIDAVNAEDARLSDAVNAATILIERQEVEVNTARHSLNVARVTYGQAQISLRNSQDQLAIYRAQIKEIAVAAYLQSQEDNDDEYLLSAKDINRGVKKKALIDLVSANTGDFLDELRLIEEENQIAERLADEALADIQARELQLSEELATLEADKANLERLSRELAKRRTTLQELVAKFEAESKELETFIQRKELEARARALGGSDAYFWPTAGALGGGFGPRYHPILKYWRPHQGIDIGGAHGQPIWAAHTGIVIASNYGGGYGNYIVIEHGDGTSSVYAHMSRRIAQEGDAVFVGEEIGKVGSTGLSTAPHLHFEIRLDGVPVDPIDYLPPRAS